jgi:hypothetical protein
MFYKAKYIISESELPVVFSELQTHADVALALFGGEKIIGAGFVYVNREGEYVCYGESISLRVKSRSDEDSKLLNKMLGGKQYDL